MYRVLKNIQHMSNVKKTLIDTYFWQMNCLTYSFMAGQPVPSSQGSKPRGVDPGDKVGKRSVDEIANMVYTVVQCTRVVDQL